MEWSEPTIIEQPAGALAPAQVTPHASVTSVPADAEEAAPPDPVAPPDLDLLGDQIADLSARIQAATYELLCHLRQFDRHCGWEGFRSCAHWLNWRTGLNLGAAREKLRAAAALAELNHVSAAMACGVLSYSKVRAITRVADTANEARLVAVACGATAEQVERLVRAWRRADRAADADAEQMRLASRSLSTRVDEDGMVVLRGRLTPEVGAVLLRALEAALEQVPAAAEDGAPTVAQRRADALGLVAESALAGKLDPGNPGDRFQVTVHVDPDTLPARETVTATPDISAETPAGSPGPRSPRPRQRDPTPAWRSSNRHPASTSRQPPRAASPAMPASWCCATPPTARSSTAAAEPAPSPPPCAAPSRAGIATSVSSPAATAATATPITSCTGPMAGPRSSQTWFPSADSTTGRCMKKAFRWSLPPRDSSGSCARMASRCRRCHRQPAGREHRWRRPWHVWRRPASPSVPIPLPPSGTESRWT